MLSEASVREAPLASAGHHLKRRRCDRRLLLGARPRRSAARARIRLCGHDVGISVLITSTADAVVESARMIAEAPPRVRRYQPLMDRSTERAGPTVSTTMASVIHTFVEHLFASGKETAPPRRGPRHGVECRRDARPTASHRATTRYHGPASPSTSSRTLRLRQRRRGRNTGGSNAAFHDAALSPSRPVQLQLLLPWVIAVGGVTMVPAVEDLVLVPAREG